MTSSYERSGPVAYLYVLGASSDPDRVECCVPWEIDHRAIFFGPACPRPTVRDVLAQGDLARLDSPTSLSRNEAAIFPIANPSEAIAVWPYRVRSDRRMVQLLPHA